MNSNFLNKIAEKINADDSLAKNIVISNVFENVQTKAQYMSEYDTLALLHTQLSNVKSYVISGLLNESINDIGSHMQGIATKHPAVIARRKAYAFDLQNKVVALKDTDAYKSPRIKMLVESFTNNHNIVKRPDYYNFSEVLGELNQVNEHKEVVALKNQIVDYIDNNKKTLLLLETVDQLGTVPNLYDETISTINEMVSTDKISSARLEMKLDPIGAKNSIVNTAIQMLKNWEGSNVNHFNIGTGAHGLINESYIGPAVKNKSGLLFYADGAFLKITKNKVNENSNGVRYIYGKSGDYTLYEVSAPEVFKSNKEFYRLVESFSELEFVFGDGKIVSSLKQLPIEIKLNESENLDLFIDGRKVENVSEVKFEEMFQLESSDKKNAAIAVLNNTDKLYNIDFVKFVMNENNSSMIINIDKDYYVNSRLNEGKVSVYKMNGIQLYKHLRDRFNYDVRNIFSVELNEAFSSYQKLSKEQTELKVYIDELKKLHESLVLAQDGIQDDELRDDMGELGNNVQDAIGSFEDQVIVKGDEMEDINGDPEMMGRYFGVGDKVQIQEPNMAPVNGQVVVDAGDDNYSIATDDGDVVDAPGTKLILIEVEVLPDGEIADVEAQVVDAETPVDVTAQMPPEAMDAQIPPVEMGAQMPPEAMGAQVPPVEMGAQVPPEAMGAQVPPEAMGAEMPPIEMGAQVPPEAMGAQVPPEAMGAQVPPEAMGAQMPPEAMGAQMPPEIEGAPAPMPVEEMPPAGEPSPDGETVEFELKEGEDTPEQSGEQASDQAAGDQTSGEEGGGDSEGAGVDMSDSKDGDSQAQKDNDSQAQKDDDSQAQKDDDDSQAQKDDDSQAQKDDTSQSLDGNPMKKVVQNVTGVPEISALATPNTGTNTLAKDASANAPTTIKVDESSEPITSENEGIGKVTEGNNGLDSGGPEMAKDSTDYSMANESADLTPAQLKQWDELMNVPDRNKRLEMLMRRLAALRLEESSETQKTNSFLAKLQEAVSKLRTELGGAPDGPDDVTYNPTEIPGVNTPDAIHESMVYDKSIVDSILKL